MWRGSAPRFRGFAPRFRGRAPRPSEAPTLRPSVSAQERPRATRPSDPPNPQEPPSEAPQSHRVNPLKSQEEGPAGHHPKGLMTQRGLDPPVPKREMFVASESSGPARSLVSPRFWAQIPRLHVFLLFKRTFPPEHKRKSTNRTSFPGYPCHMSPFSGHAILCKQGRQGRGALPLV